MFKLKFYALLNINHMFDGWISNILLPRVSLGLCIGCIMFIFLCLRASKQRRKADRIVLECQEQAYWLVNKPPVSPEHYNSQH